MTVILTENSISGMQWPAAWAGRKNGQIWSVSESCQIEEVQLRLSRLGTIVTGTVEIWSTEYRDGGYFPSTQLGTDAYDGSEWSTSGEVKTFTFDIPLDLEAGYYAVVLTQDLGDVNNCVKWFMSSGGTTGMYYTDADPVWRSAYTRDYHILGTWAGAPPDLPGKPINPTPADAVAGVSLNLALLEWESGS